MGVDFVFRIGRSQLVVDVARGLHYVCTAPSRVLHKSVRERFCAKVRNA
jgi:hypothetical protein